MPLTILQVSTHDIAGGAERVAFQLFRAYRQAGHQSWLAVGQRHTDEEDVYEIPNDRQRPPWTRMWLGLGRGLKWRVRGMGRLRQACEAIGQPLRTAKVFWGLEDFDFPGTRRLLDILPDKPDVIHCHNLHGGYFDLRALPWLCRQAPVLLTLHDAWLMGGHCAHSFTCEGWRTGCLVCRRLDILPRIRRDQAARNWRRKADIFRHARVYLTTPCQWLMDKAKQSHLWPSVIEGRVIPNGVDLELFRPADKAHVRSQLGLPQGAHILLFVAHGIRRNMWKDFAMLEKAMAGISARPEGGNTLFLALGESGPDVRLGKARIRFIPYSMEPSRTAMYYQAADIYTHAARIDTFPNTVLEAAASGLPVVATAVGGIPEQVKGLSDGGADDLNRYPPEEATGILVAPGDAEAMSRGATKLLANHLLRRQLSENAARRARAEYGLPRQVDAMLDWYPQIAAQWRKEAQP